MRVLHIREPVAGVAGELDCVLKSRHARWPTDTTTRHIDKQVITILANIFTASKRAAPLSMSIAALGFVWGGSIRDMRMHLPFIIRGPGWQ